MSWEDSSPELASNKVQLGAVVKENYTLCTVGDGTSADRTNLSTGPRVLKA